MPSCCARNCCNRAEQGFRLFRFPKDKKRKEDWCKLCDKDPKEYSRLCECHFDDSQFENGRQDGWRKLKPNAIPTIFVNEKNIIEGLRDEIESSAIILSKENVIDETNVQHDYLQPVFAFVDTSTQTEEDSNVATFQTAYFSDKNETVRQANEIKYLRKELAHTQEKNNILTSKLKKERLLRLKAKKNMKADTNLKKKYATLSKRLEEMPILKQFASGLTHSRSKWSPECLKLATQIRYAVGWKAYLYLKKDLKLPLPSYSTICRDINQVDFSSGVLKDVISLMEKKRKTHKSLHESDCVLLMDEMDIGKTLEYDVSTASSLNWSSVT